jgi:16S rRNA (cytosine1402-N4)-methyltransferase
MDKREFHQSVLLQEVLSVLNVHKGGVYIDATLGGGGHTIEILKRGGVVLGIDVDEEALQFVQEKIQKEKEKYKYWRRLTLARGNFRDIQKIAIERGFSKVNGIVFDLGVSSYQLETGARGFSFLKEGPLDMRMDNRLTVTASDLVNGLTVWELEKLFRRFGEERYAKQIAKAIGEKRKVAKIATTRQLAGLIEEKIRRRAKDIHPATRVFQALRIAVNDELQSLREGLKTSINLLVESGRVAVISFHSLEDRIVKQIFSEEEQKGRGQVITKKPITPSEKEKMNNPRARSAKLRVFERRS